MANDFKIYGDPVGIPNPKSDVYTKAETDKLLDTKADSEEVEQLRSDVKIGVPNQIADSIRPVQNSVSLLMEEFAVVDEKVNQKADKTTTDNLRSLLDTKANKEDVVSAYRFCGSVDAFDEYMTVATYEFIPCDNPTYNGVVVGTYDAENRTITIDSDKLSGWEDYDVVVPIEKITVPKGYYECDEYISVAGMDGYWFVQDRVAYKKTDEEVVTEVHVGTYGYLESGTYKLGTLNKLSSVQVKLAEMPFYGAEYDVVDTLEVGDVYNVLEDGMNYAWTGTEWDALGGEHKDIEARKMLGDVETALDEIIEIQNSLIGGEAE